MTCDEMGDGFGDDDDDDGEDDDDEDDDGCGWTVCVEHLHPPSLLVLLPSRLY